MMAYLALLQVSTWKGWIDVMNDAIDSVDIGEQPSRYSTYITSLLDNAPNYLVGCVIKKRLYIPDVAHAEIVRFKGSFVEIDGLILVFRL